MAELCLDMGKIRQALAERECSEREMARQMEVAYSYLNRLLAGKRRVGSRAIAGFLLAGFAWDKIFQVIPDETRSHRVR